MTQRVSEYLEIDGGHTRCRKCSHDLGPSTGNWKNAAICREGPMNGAGGEPYQSAAFVLLRLFICPGCGLQLGTETAVTDDPYLEDIISES